MARCGKYCATNYGIKFRLGRQRTRSWHLEHRELAGTKWYPYQVTVRGAFSTYIKGAAVFHINGSPYETSPPLMFDESPQRLRIQDKRPQQTIMPLSNGNVPTKASEPTSKREGRGPASTGT